MTPTELLLLNLEEVRRRSLIIWRGIPPRQTGWKPEPGARSCIEIIRHILKAEWNYTRILQTGRSPRSGDSPYDSKPLTDINSELEFAEPFRQMFLALIGSYTTKQLIENKVDRSDAD